MGRPKYDYDYIVDYVNKEGYELLNVVNGTKEHMSLLCENGHLWDINFGDFLYGRRCSICKKEEEQNKKLIEIKDHMLSLGYTLLSTRYINNSSLLKVMCPLGHIFHVSSANFKKGRRCSECYKYKKLSQSYIEEYFGSFGYKILNSYESANKKLKVMCPDGHIFYMPYSKFYTGRRCPYCSMSSGEQEIARILDKHNIYYSSQKRFNECKNVNTLPFDFYLIKRNTLIEFDGQQHFEYGRFDLNLLDLMNLKHRDKIKTKFCKDSGIKLIRIPYWEFNNIENILIKELNLKDCE